MTKLNEQNLEELSDEQLVALHREQTNLEQTEREQADSAQASAEQSVATVRVQHPYIATLIKRYERELYSFLSRYLGDATMAEDAFQATFLQVHLKSHLFDPSRKFRPWLYTVATNRAIDLQRRNKRHKAVSLDQSNRVDQAEVGTLANLLPSFAPGPGERFETSERSEWVRRAVATLPEPLQAAVNLVYFQGLKYREAAAELHVPVGTVKSRLHSAVGRLGQQWDSSNPYN